MPVSDPFSDADNNDNWILWPIKCWPLWVRIPLLIVLGLFFWWLSTYLPNKSSAAVPAAVEQIVVPVEQVLAPAPVDCTGPFGVQTTTLEQFAACAEVIGVERHEVGCTKPGCYKLRRGCPTFDATGKLLYLLMPGEYIVLLQDGRMIRSDGELPPGVVGTVQCAEAPP